jgi:serine O-acetyltransferase
MGVDAVGLYRWGRWFATTRVPVLPGLLRQLVRLLYRADLASGAEVGPGLELGYGGLEVVVEPDTRIGRSCFLGHGVCVGRRTPDEGAPVLGDFVHVSTGARILGPVRVGDYAVIGANALVLEDVAHGAVVAGIPAVELRRDPSPEESYQRYLASRERR